MFAPLTAGVKFLHDPGEW